MTTSYFTGLFLGFSLILAIGAQNAFVLKQGLKKHHVFLVCFICALSDAILISLGVGGFGIVIKQFPEIEQIARYLGALFLVVYGLKSLIAAFNNSQSLTPEGELPKALMKTALTCLAFTWLNPHVYLDTIVLLGSISTQYESTKIAFALGAISSSFIFFFSLGYGARILIPIFEKPKAWQVLDFIIALIMFAIAFSLIFT